MSDLTSKNKKKTNLYAISGVLVSFFLAGCNYLIFLGLQSSPGFIFTSLFLQLVILLLFANHILNMLKIAGYSKFVFPLKINRMLNNVMLNASYFFVLFLMTSKERLEHDFVEFNAELTGANKLKYAAGEILILLPRCMQNSECKYNVVNNMENCTSCGKCDVKTIREIIKETGVKAVVVTGGTQARALVKKNNPKIIIAVACERELISGMFDVPNCEVIGLINERPEGPCFNTRFSVAELSATLNTLMKK